MEPTGYHSRHLVSQPVRPSSPGMFSLTSAGTTSFSISSEDSEYGDRAVTPTLTTGSQDGLSYEDLPPTYDEAQAQAESTTRSTPAYAYASAHSVETPDELRLDRLVLADAAISPATETGRLDQADPSQTSSIEAKRLLSKALAWTQQLCPPEKQGPHAAFLNRLVVIPQADLSSVQHGTGSIHFERAYSPSLLSYGIDAVIFATFLQGADTLSECSDSELPVVALLDAYLRRVNDVLFRPRNLLIRMLDTESLLDVLPISSAGRSARDAVVKVLHKGGASPREKAEALCPWTEPLQWDVPGTDSATEVLSRAGPSNAHTISADGPGTAQLERFDSPASVSVSGSRSQNREAGVGKQQRKCHDDSSSISSDSDSSISTDDNDSVYQEYLDRVKSIDDKTTKALSKGKQTPDEIARSRDKALKLAQQFLERRSERSAKRQEREGKRAMRREQRKPRHEFWQQKHSLMRGSSDLSKYEKKAKKRELKMERREGKRALKEEWREAKWQRKQAMIEETRLRRKEMIRRVVGAGQTWMAGRHGPAAVLRVDDMQWLVVEALDG